MHYLQLADMSDLSSGLNVNISRMDNWELLTEVMAYVIYII